MTGKPARWVDRLSFTVECGDPLQVPSRMVLCETDRLLFLRCETGRQIEKRCGELVHRQLHSVAKAYADVGGVPFGDAVPVRVSNCGAIRWATIVVSRKSGEALLPMTNAYRTVLRAAFLYRVESLVVPLRTIDAPCDVLCDRVASMHQAIRELGEGAEAATYSLERLYLVTDDAELVPRIEAASSAARG